MSNSSTERSRIVRERKTVERMILMYCHEHHGTSNGLCVECEELLKYANQRLDTCPFQEQKTPCVKCLVHCYKPAMREKIRKLMRYSGPRMIYKYPVLTILHLVDGLKARIENR